MRLRVATDLAALLAAGLASPALAESDNAKCELLPPEVRATAIYAGHSERHMCKAGLPALWQGLPDDASSVMRFTFSSGHSLFWRSATITERADGTGRLEVAGGGHERLDVHSPWRDERRVTRRLSREDMEQLREAVDAAGAFDHTVGTWDRRAEGETAIYLHCQLLEMERADAAGYRFSSVNIGCNRPSALMPLVDAVIALGRLEMVRINWAGYP